MLSSKCRVDLRLHGSEPAVIRETEPLDIYLIAPRLREMDTLEVELASGQSPEEALRKAYQVSDVCYTVEVSGEPEIMFGLRSKEDEDRTAFIWLLATDRLLDVSKLFLRCSRPMIQALGQDYAVLENAVYEHNEVHIRWLEWVGAEFLEPVEALSGARFLPFRILTESVTD
jgi:hypothetical protein